MAKSAKQKLLISAIRAFAEKGFRATTISDVVSPIGANIAAVNYHFGSKDQLFRAALREAFHLAELAHPLYGDLPSEAEPLEKIAAFSRAILQRSLDQGPGGDFERMMARTVHSPESPVVLIMEEIQELALRELDGLVAQCLPNESPIIREQVRVNLIVLSTVLCRDTFLYQSPPAGENESTRDFVDRQVHAVTSSITAIASRS